MKLVPIPVELLQVGSPLPVDIFSAQGQLLLRAGQPIVSDQHRARLHGFSASAQADDAQAWQRAYERMVHDMMQAGADVREIAAASMPQEIRATDYVAAQPLSGGWLDLQTVLRGILYQGGLSINPLPRLAAIRSKLEDLLHADADAGLFTLFQALTDNQLGYTATHGLLCAVICSLTGARLGLPQVQRDSLVSAALTMNIGVAREQDALTRQIGPLSVWQRDLIGQHPSTGVDALRAIGVDDPEWLDLVRWHHQWDSAEALPALRTARQLLHLSDIFVARTAARRTRPGLPPLQTVKAMVLGAGANDDALGVGSALAQTLGFYPPGTYVRMASGETAVSVQRGARANTPWLIPIVGRDGIALANYVCRDSSWPEFAISASLTSDQVRVVLAPQRVARARERIARNSP